jgi:hypothetical protein
LSLLYRLEPSVYGVEKNMNSDTSTGVAIMDDGIVKGKKRKGVLIIAALIILNILIAGVALSWRL